MPSLIRREKNTHRNCGTQIARNKSVRHKKRCSTGTMYYNHCAKSCSTFQDDWKYHFATKHSTPKPDVTFQYKHCKQKFPGFHALQQHKDNQHGCSYPDNNCWTWWHHQRIGWYESQRRVAFMSTFPNGIWTCKGETQSLQLRSRKSQWNSSEWEAWCFFQQYKMCSASESGFWDFLKNIEDGKCRCFHAH